MPPVIDPGGDEFESGDDPHGVCVAFDDDPLAPFPSWTRLDDPAGYRLAADVEIERGRDSSSDVDKGRIGPGTLRVTLYDTTGILNPHDDTQPFFGKLNPGLQIGVGRWNPVDGTWHTRFQGLIVRWLWDFSDASGNVAQVTIEAADALDYFAGLEMTPGNFGDDPPQYVNAGDIYYAGGVTIPENSTYKHVNQRLNQILDDAEWSVLKRRIFSGNVTVQESVYQRGTPVIDALLEAADSEFPGIQMFYASRSNVVTFHGRFARFRPDRPGYGINQWLVGSRDISDADPAVVPIGIPQFRRDRDDLVNEALALPTANVGFTEDETESFLVTDGASKTAYGRRSMTTMEGLITFKGHDEDGNETLGAEETLRFAQFYVDNDAEPRTYVGTLVFKGRSADHPNAEAIWDMLCRAELGDIVTLSITYPPSGEPVFDETDFYIEKITESERPAREDMREVDVSFEVSPRARYDNPTFGGCPDNDEMMCAQALAGAQGSLDWVNVGFSNDGPETDPGAGDPWDPLREEFFTADDPGNPGHPLSPSHNFRTAWFRWTPDVESFLHLEVDLPDAGAVIIVTTDPVPPPSNRDTVLDSGSVSAAGTVTLDPVAAISGAVWIGVGSFVGDGGTFTVTWDSALS